MKKITTIIIISAVIYICFWNIINKQKVKPLREDNTVKQTYQLKQKENENKEGELLDFALSGYGTEGIKKWILKGKSADILNDIVKLSDVTAIAYGEQGSLTIKADKGVFNRTKQDVFLNDNISITTNDGTELLTDALNWNAKTQNISSDTYISLNKDSIKSSGKGLEAFPSLNTVKVKKDIKVSISNNAEYKPVDTKRNLATTITCDGPLDINYSDNKAIFYNNVCVTNEEGEIYADRMDVEFDPKEKSITRIVAVDNVKIVRGKNITYSSKATYSAKDKKITLTGRPKLVIYPE